MSDHRHSRERAASRSEQAAARRLELAERLEKLRALPGTNSTKADATEAKQSATRACERARYAAEQATSRYAESAQAHDSAALAHDRAADAGTGDVTEHRTRADWHRNAARADRAAAAGSTHSDGDAGEP